MTVIVLNRACTDQNDAYTVKCNHMEDLLAPCKHYHMAVSSRQKIHAEVSDKNFSLKNFPWFHFHMVVRTVAVDMLTLCLAPTAMTVLAFITACTE